MCVARRLSAVSVLSLPLPEPRRVPSRRILAAVLVVSATISTSCWETAPDDYLRVRNETDRPIDVVVERVSGEQFGLENNLRPGQESIMNPRDDPDVDDEGSCTTGPVIAFQDGEEIQRFELPICFGDSLTLVVDGEP